MVHMVAAENQNSKSVIECLTYIIHDLYEVLDSKADLKQSLGDIEYLFDQTEYYSVIAKGANRQLKKLLTRHFKRNINLAFLDMSSVLHNLEELEWRINELKKFSGYDDLALYLRERIVEFEKKNMKREINRLIYLANHILGYSFKKLGWDLLRLFGRENCEFLIDFVQIKELYGQEAEYVWRDLIQKYIKWEGKLKKKFGFSL